jgi:hypothetical protein
MDAVALQRSEHLCSASGLIECEISRQSFSAFDRICHASRWTGLT